MERSIYNVFDTMYPYKKSENIIMIRKDYPKIHMKVDNLEVFCTDEKVLVFKKRKGNLEIPLRNLKKIYLKKIAGVKYYDSDFYEMHFDYTSNHEPMKEVVSINSINYYTPVDEIETFLNSFLTFHEVIRKNIHTVEEKYMDLVEQGELGKNEEIVYDDIHTLHYEEKFYAKKSNDRVIAGMKREGKIFNLQNTILKTEIEEYKTEAMRNSLTDYFFTKSQMSNSNYVDVWAENDNYATYIKNLKKTPFSYYLYLLLIFVGSLAFIGSFIFVISQVTGF